MRKYALIVLFLQIIAIPTICKVTPTSLISDNMVLQQQTNIKLWGKAAPDRKVKVSFSWDKKGYTSISDANGNWLVEVAKDIKIHLGGKIINSNNNETLIFNPPTSHINIIDGEVGALLLKAMGQKIIIDLDNMKIESKN